MELQHGFKFPLPLVAEDEVGVRAQPDPTVVGRKGRSDVHTFNSLPKRQKKLHNAALARRIWADEDGEGTEFQFSRVLKTLEVFYLQFSQHGFSPYSASLAAQTIIVRKVV
jgi:hypothetical protein